MQLICKVKIKTNERLRPGPLWHTSSAEIQGQTEQYQLVNKNVLRLDCRDNVTSLKTGTRL